MLQKFCQIHAPKECHAAFEATLQQIVSCFALEHCPFQFKKLEGHKYELRCTQGTENAIWQILATQFALEEPLWQDSTENTKADLTPTFAESLLPPNQALTARGKWPIVGEKAPRNDDSPWQIHVEGLVAKPRIFQLSDLNSRPQTILNMNVHCVTRWSKPNATFQGILLAELLEECTPLPQAKFIRFVARSERNHDTSLPLNEALALNTLIAFEADGQPLEEIHGGPIRTVVPGRYFYKSLKWLERIELLSEDKLGFWEGENGYHNNANPWLEERYIVSNLNKAKVAKILQTKDMTGLSLLGIQANKMQLANLLAENAQLRDASFSEANLMGANFTNANLSNAHLQKAQLQNANFTGADLEGADFRGADLRGANLTGSSLFGASFCAEPDTTDLWGPALIDEHTIIESASLDKLSQAQQDFLKPFTKG